MLAILKKEASFKHDLHGIHNSREGRKPLAYGNAVLSNFPVHFWDDVAFGASTLGEKGFLYAEVTVGKWHLPIINLHLDYRSRKRRIRQVEQVIDYLDKREQDRGVLKPIICGDFNTSSRRVGDAVQHLFRYLLSGHDYKLYPVSSRTFPSLLPARSIDFIFLPAPLRRRHCEVCNVQLSDHFPVLLDIGIPELESTLPSTVMG